MSSTRVPSLLALLAVAVAVAAGLLAVPASAKPRTYVPSCTGKALFKPAQIVIACADGNFFVDRLRWSRWTRTAAVARGAAHYNDCRPNCASGHFHRSRARVTLSRPRTCGRAHRREFTRIVVKARGVGGAAIPLGCGG